MNKFITRTMAQAKITKTKIAIFEGKKIRRHWDGKAEKWYFSVADVVGALSDSIDPLAYWRKLKERLKQEGSETVTKCHGLKMLATDGKMRLTDTADTETMLRIIQSIPSSNAEPFKLWLARVAEKTRENLDKQKSRISAGYLRDLNVVLKPDLPSATSIIV